MTCIVFLLSCFLCYTALVLAGGNQNGANNDEGWHQWSCDELTPALCSDLTVETGYIPIPHRPGIQLKYWRYKRLLQEEDKEPSTSRYPILALHGGPGWPHGYMLPLKQQACRGRDIIFYDQGGCGESVKDISRNGTTLSLDDHPFLLDPAYYSEEELPAVLRHLQLDTEGFHLLGQSWGTRLAQLFVLNSNQTQGLQSIILSGPLSDSQSYIQAQWDENEGNLGSMIPPFLKERIRQLEAARLYDSREYEAIGNTLSNFFTLRTAPWPDCMANAAKGLNKDIYVGMQGASEFTMSGTLANINLTGRLHEINVPVLLTSGKFDTMRPSIVETMHRKIRISEWVMFNQSGHVSMIDQPGEMNDVVHDFLSRIESFPAILFEEQKSSSVFPPTWIQSRDEDETLEAPKQKSSGGIAQQTDFREEWLKYLASVACSFFVGVAVGSKLVGQNKIIQAKNGYSSIS